MREGSNIIAMYLVDKQLYRAKVEQVKIADGKRSFLVRFIDYGNVSQVEDKHLYPWDPVFELIPPQAICCKLRNVEVFKTSFLAGSRDQEEFVKFMLRNNPFHLTVHQVYETRDFLFKCSVISSPELSVDLLTSAGQNVVSKLKMSAHFKDLVVDQSSSSKFTSSSSKLLKRNKLDFLDPEIPSQLVKAPDPIHLKDAPLDSLKEDETDLSPVHPIVASIAVEKVHMWLDRECNEDAENIEERNIRNNNITTNQRSDSSKDHNCNDDNISFCFETKNADVNDAIPKDPVVGPQVRMGSNP